MLGVIWYFMLHKVIEIPIWSDLQVNYNEKTKKIILCTKLGSVQFFINKNISFIFFNNVICLHTKMPFLSLLITTLKNIKLFILDLHQFYKLFFKIQGANYSLGLLMNTCVFSLGYSHSILINLPQNIIINTYGNAKDIFIVKSFNRAAIGNFLSLIKSFKKWNVYSGSGIVLSNQFLYIKTIKKKK